MSKALPPRSPTRYEDMPRSAQERHAVLVDTFGQWLFWIRNQSIGASYTLVEDDAMRRKLGAIRRKPYEGVAAMPGAAREAALKLAQETLDGFLERLLWALGDEGVDCRFDERHAYRFRIQTELVDIATGNIIEDEPINRGGTFLGKEFGRWLNRYSESKPSEPKE